MHNIKVCAPNEFVLNNDTFVNVNVISNLGLAIRNAFTDVRVGGVDMDKTISSVLLNRGFVSVVIFVPSRYVMNNGWEKIGVVYIYQMQARYKQQHFIVKCLRFDGLSNCLHLPN